MTCIMEGSAPTSQLDMRVHDLIILLLSEALINLCFPLSQFIKILVPHSIQMSHLPLVGLTDWSSLLLLALNHLRYSDVTQLRLRPPYGFIHLFRPIILSGLDVLLLFDLQTHTAYVGGYIYKERERARGLGTSENYLGWSWGLERWN
jgi:hypothetical protein